VSGDNFDTGLKKIVYGLSVNFQEQTSILVNGGKIYIIRDLLGIHPLFLCENNKFIAVASERKAFWKNKIYGTIERVLPGSIIQLNAQNKIYISQKYLSEVIPFGNRSPDQFLIKIKEAMIKSIQRRLCTVKNTPGSLFSGGLDSSLMQHFIDNLGVKSKSILIGMVGSKDIQQLDPPLNDLTRIEIEPENLFDKLTYILEMIEVPDSLLLEIGFLFLNAAEFSKKNGINGLFCGQGADELFAGYNKYLRALRISEGDYINQLNNDLDTQALKSIESCEMILSNFNGIHLLLPYLDIQVIDLVRRIDPIHLINLNKNIDKALLRIIAANEQGLSKLTLKKKSALQFSTRIHQTLDAFIRKLGFNREFSKEIGFKNHYRELFLNYIFHKLNYPSNLTNNQYEEINKKINY